MLSDQHDSGRFEPLRPLWDTIGHTRVRDMCGTPKPPAAFDSFAFAAHRRNDRRSLCRT
jgi:hypothetical protein